jgi:DNA polymerase I
MNKPFAKDLITFRKTKKVYDYVNEYNTSNVGGFLHPSIDLNHATSGRSNSQDPNIQNIPIRDEKSAEIIRRGIIPSPGWLITEGDFKAIEVRVMACYTGDPALIAYIMDPSKDMHRDLAMRIFKLAKKEITKPLRHIGKNDFVFPQFYGDWYETCAKSAWEDCDVLNTVSGVSVKEHLASTGISSLKAFMKHMQKVENDFWDMLKITKDWRRKIVKDYLKKGYVDTFFGFRRTGYLERNQIINTPVQGTAFHCLLWAYNRLDELFTKKEMQSKLIGQIHDSILVDTHLEEKERVWKLMKRVMEKEITETFDWLVVPLEVEIEATDVDRPWSTKKMVA